MSGKKTIVALSIGGNQKDTLDCFEGAILKMPKRIGEVKEISSLYISKAWGMKKGTPDFYNQVLLISSDLKPKKLLKKTQKLEKKLGRKSKSIDGRYVDRPIDIDILFYGNKIVNQTKLTIPHYLIQERRFVLEPLAELIPDFIHPVLKKTIKKLLLSCPDKLKVIRIIK